MCSGGVRASIVSCWTRVLSSTLSRDIGMPGPPPLEPPPRRPRPPPDLLPPSPRCPPPPAQSGANPISAGFTVSAGFSTQTPAMFGDSVWLIGAGADSTAAVLATAASANRNGLTTPSFMRTPSPHGTTLAGDKRAPRIGRTFAIASPHFAGLSLSDGYGSQRRLCKEQP